VFVLAKALVGHVEFAGRDILQLPVLLEQVYFVFLADAALDYLLSDD
jgi:hypothetical protein